LKKALLVKSSRKEDESRALVVGRKASLLNTPSIDLIVPLIADNDQYVGHFDDPRDNIQMMQLQFWMTRSTRNLK
jgi:hypothetical protein